MNIGERIRYLRKKQGLTQDDLAKKLGYKSRSTINKIELDINEITQSKIIEFAKVLGCSPVYLLGLTNDEQNAEADVFEKKGALLSKKTITKKQIAEALKDARIKAGLTQLEVSKKIGKAQQTIASWETGQAQLDANTLFLLCDIYGTTVDAVFGLGAQDNISLEEMQIIKKFRDCSSHGKEAVKVLLNYEYKNTEQPKLIQIPYVEKELNKPQEMIDINYYLSKVSAGGGEWLNDDEEIIKIQLPLTNASRRADFAVSVRGDSMKPKYYDGDLLLVRQQPAVELGETGIFIVNNNGYVKKMGKNELISINDQYENIPIHDYDRIDCIGKIEGVIPQDDAKKFLP